MSNDEDILFNRFFIKENGDKVSFAVLSEKLNLDDESLLKYLRDRNLDIINKHNRNYLNGYRYRDDARTPAQSNSQFFPKYQTGQKQLDKINESNNGVEVKLAPKPTDYKSVENLKNNKLQDQEFLENYRLKVELEEYKNKIRTKNKELDSYKDQIKKHAKEKLDLEDSYRRKLEEAAEKISLGHSLNEQIQNCLNKTKSNLEQLSGKSVKILLLTDIHDNHDISKLHSRTIFIPKDQEYNFIIGNEQKHQNPDLRTHFL